MKQYNGIKAKYPDALLLFRVGDFYETFGEDAVRASKILDIVLTKRKNGAAAYVELAGFPHHSLDTYLPKLVRAGNRVAICDQLEDPKQTKTIVKRGVTELVTPGVSYHDQVLNTKANNFLAAVSMNSGRAGVAFLDISTGEFIISEGNLETVDKLLQGFQPSEVLFQKQKTQDFELAFGNKFHTFRLEDWAFQEDFAEEKLQKQFGTNSLKGFGVSELSLGIIAAGAALHYLEETKHLQTEHIQSISRIEEDKYVWLDRFTIRNLELVHSPHQDASTLLDVIDRTVSPMGARLLRRWLVLPLKELDPIQFRLNAVSQFKNQPELGSLIAQELRSIGDLERLISKAAARRISPREVVQLGRALKSIGPIKEACKASESKELGILSKALEPCTELRTKIETQLKEDAPHLLHKGGVIAKGVDDELDELRQLAYQSKDVLVQIQLREQELTGIPSLKIAYNNVFGYYLEVRNAHKDKVPESWIRKQTLTQAERYITEELKILESKILGAEEKIAGIESRLYHELVEVLAQNVSPVQKNAQILAQLDCLISLAVVAEENNYVQPELHLGYELEIKGGRHPVIEQHLPLGESYVSNDVRLDQDQQQIIMITGPNMSGKSALLRQTALISLLAQMGSFVPADEAKLGLIDKVFTRVGASDNISSGESTFMVEMNETASILNNLSDRSLVILDEIGRGTSTYDGISIAWAIAEFLHEYPKAKAKTLFATHYHELNEMSAQFPRIKNFNVSVREVKGKIIFLRKLVAGGSNHSFGIHVAKLAGMPKQVLSRAESVLKQLEKSHGGELAHEMKSMPQDDDLQLSFFQLDDPVLLGIKEELIQTDINTLTPVEALMKLNEIKKMVGG